MISCVYDRSIFDGATGCWILISVSKRARERVTTTKPCDSKSREKKF